MSRETKAFVPSLYGDAKMKNHVQFFLNYITVVSAVCNLFVIILHFFQKYFWQKWRSSYTLPAWIELIPDINNLNKRKFIIYFITNDSAHILMPLELTCILLLGIQETEHALLLLRQHSELIHLVYYRSLQTNQLLLSCLTSGKFPGIEKDKLVPIPQTYTNTSSPHNINITSYYDWLFHHNDVIIMHNAHL